MVFKETKPDFSTKTKFTDELACFASYEAGFVTTEGNEAASANVDVLLEKAIIASKSKEHKETKEIEAKLKQLKQTDGSETNSKDAIKESKKELKKVRKKAATKTSVATMLRAKKEVANELTKGQGSTGDAFRDGKSGIVGMVLEVINPMHYFKMWLAKLAALVVPHMVIATIYMCVIVLIFGFMVEILSPLANVGEALTGVLSVFTVDTDTFSNEELSSAEIDEIVVSSGCDETQEVVLRYALSKVGYPYSQELRTSGDAYDCSSLAYYSWKEADVDISFGNGYPPSAAEGARMLNADGKTVMSSEEAGFSLLPGDLIYYGGSNNGRYKGIYHVAIYVGNGKAVEALNTRYGVVYQTLRTDRAIMVCRPNKE